MRPNGDFVCLFQALHYENLTFYVKSLLFYLIFM